MEETKRQKQVAGLINEEMNDIFLRMGFGMMDGGMISIASVKITPDLFDARIHLSMFKVNNPEEVLKKINEKNKDIRLELGKRVRHQLRSVPQLSFYIDDTLDYVDKMEVLFKKIKEEDEQREKGKK
jgi:ribosome-binding factor A